MLELKKLRELVEVGYSSSIQNNEAKSKQFFWDILLFLNEMSAQSDQLHPGQCHYSKADDRESMLVLAYYLSEFGHEGIFPGARMSQQETIKKMAAILNIKPNTLKNQRDHFDSFTNSHRKGWKKKLNTQQQGGFDQMRALSQIQALSRVETILGLKANAS